MWPKLYVLSLYILWEYMIFIDTYDCVFISVVLWLLFFIATRDYKCHIPTKMKLT